MNNCPCSKIRVLLICVLAILCPAWAGFGQTLTVSATPSSLTIYPGQQNVPVAISLGSSAYTGPVTVTMTGLPSGISVSPLTLTAGGSGSLMLSASVAAGQEGFSPTALPMPTSWTAAATVVAAAGSTQATASFPLTVSISNASFTPAASAITLPVVTINTGGAPIADKTTNVPGTITITSADGQTSYLPNSSDTDNTANFHLHGDSTILMPKLPYHIKLNTSLDLLNTMGLKCPYVTSSGKSACDKSKSYLLLANYDDKTLLRDWSAFALANAIPMGNGYLSSAPGSPTPSGTSTLMPWAPHSLFVELYLNGVYEGNYQLIEEVKVDSHRINITELTEADTAPAEVTGGYLMEIDHHADEDYVFFTPVANLPIGLIDPDFSPDPQVAAQNSYISGYVGAAETALFSSSFTDPLQGWRAYYDEASAINFYIVNDVMGNVDGGDFYSSDYFYKDVNNPLLYMGPVWDFDVSAGNINYAAVVDPTVPWMQAQATWYVQWFQDPGFKADVVTQWNALKQNGIFDAWLASISKESATLEQSQVNNFGRWPMQGIEVWPNAEAAGSYDGEVAYLTNWIQLRIAYLDSIFNGKAQTATTLGVGSGALRNGAPATFTAQVTGGAAPAGAVAFLSSGVFLGTSPLSAAGTASLTTSNLPVGTNTFQAVYNGDSTNALSASASQSLTVIAPPASTVTGLAGPVVSTASQANPIGFTATVIATTGAATPTGTVTFSMDGTSGTAVPLSGTAQAGYSIASLAPGTHTLVSSYSGDANDALSSGSLIIVQPVGDFTVAASPAAINGVNGQSISSAISVTPQSGFNGTVAFGCSGLPTGGSCSFSPATVTPSGAPATTTLTISLPAAVSRDSRPLFPGATLAAALCCLGWKRRRRVQTLLILAAGVFGLGLLTACGTSSNPTPSAVATTITVNATAGVLAHTAVLTLTVQ